MDKCAGKNTKIIIFASTVFKDANWLSMLKHFKEKDISVTPMTSIYESGVNQVEMIYTTLEEKAKKDYEKSQRGGCIKLKSINVDSDSEEDDEDPEKKQKYLSPEYIFVFDDLSVELRESAIESLLKKNRHFLCKVIISSQAYIDMSPSERTQLDFLLLFPKIPEEKLKQIHKDSDLSISYEKFLELYFLATKSNFNFLYVDTRNDLFREF